MEVLLYLSRASIFLSASSLSLLSLIIWIIALITSLTVSFISSICFSFLGLPRYLWLSISTVIIITFAYAKVKRFLKFFFHKKSTPFQMCLIYILLWLLTAVGGYFHRRKPFRFLKTAFKAMAFWWVCPFPHFF